jgi:hypothetical protein
MIASGLQRPEATLACRQQHRGLNCTIAPACLLLPLLLSKQRSNNQLAPSKATTSASTQCEQRASRVCKMNKTHIQQPCCALANQRITPKHNQQPGIAAATAAITGSSAADPA